MLYWNTVMLISFSLKWWKASLFILGQCKNWSFFHQYRKYKDNLFVINTRVVHQIFLILLCALLWARWDHVTFCSYWVVNNVTCHFQMEALRTRVQCSRSFPYLFFFACFHATVAELVTIKIMYAARFEIVNCFYRESLLTSALIYYFFVGILKTLIYILKVNSKLN